MPNSIEDLGQEIQECLDTFQNAVFGEDVRSALIQAIEICYEKVVELAVTHILSGKSAYQLAQENGYSGTVQEKLRDNVDKTKSETKSALQLIYGSLNQGQQKKLLKNEEVHALLKRYGVIDD